MRKPRGPRQQKAKMHIPMTAHIPAIPQSIIVSKCSKPSIKKTAMIAEIIANVFMTISYFRCSHYSQYNTYLLTGG